MEYSFVKYFILIISLFSIGSSQTNHHYFFSPGVKLGYSFGDNGGFNFGFETSLIMTGDYNDDPVYGIVLNYDWIGQMELLHIGFEYSKSVVGIELGPTFDLQKEERLYGFGITPYIGFLIYPYYHFTYLNDGSVYTGIGSFIKFPIQIDDNKYSWFRSRRLLSQY